MKISKIFAIIKVQNRIFGAKNRTAVLGAYMKRNRKPIPKLIWIAAVLLALVPCLAALSQAENDIGMHVIPNAPAAYTEKMADAVLGDWNDPDLGIGAWQSDTLVLSYVSGQSNAYRGNGALYARSEQTTADYCEVTLNFDEPRDLSSYAFLLFSVRIPRMGDGTYRVRLTVRTDDGIRHSDTEVSPDVWNTVFCDLSDLSDRTQTQSVSVSVRFQPVNRADAASPAFYLDEIGLSREAALYRTFDFLATEYEDYGGTNTYGENAYGSYMEFAVSERATDPFLETKSTVFFPVEENDAVALRFVNRTGCSRISMTEFASNGTQLGDPHEITVSSGTEMQTVAFPLTGNEISKIRFTFLKAESGTVEIYAVYPASFYGNRGSRLGSLDSCRLSEGGDKITVSGQLSATAQSGTRSQKILVFPLLPEDNAWSVDFTSRTPLASAQAEEQFSLTFPDTDHRFLTYKFAAVLQSGSSCTLIDDPVFISNPEVLAPAAEAKIYAVTKKGISGTEAWLEAEDIGVRHTVIPVHLSSLITTDSTGTPLGDTGLYRNDDYLDSLGNAITAASKNGLRVYLQLTATETESDVLNRALIHPKWQGQTGSAPLNAADEVGIAVLRAAVSELAQRWSGSVYGLIVGCPTAADNTANWENGMTAAQRVDAVAAAYRVIYTAARSANAAIDVSFAVCAEWDSAVTGPASRSLGTQGLLDALAQRLTAGGRIGWSIYLELSAPSYRTLSDGTVLTVLCAEDMPRFCEYLSLLTNRYGCDLPDIYVSDTGFSGDATPDTLRLAYTFAVLNTKSCESVRGYFIPRSVALSGGTVFRTMDTSDGGAALDALLPEFGAASWSELISGYSASSLQRRTESTAFFIQGTPVGMTGSVSLFDFSENTAGWAPNVSYVTLRNGITYLGQSNTLFIHYQQGNEARYRAAVCDFDYPRDFSACPVFSVRVAAASLPSDVREARVEFILKSGDNKMTAYGTVQSGNFTDLYFDASGFSGIRAVNSVRIRIVSENTDNIGEPTLVLSDVSVHSQNYTEDYLRRLFDEERIRYTGTNRIHIPVYVIRSLIAVGAVCILIVIYRMMRRRRRASANRSKNEFESFPHL